MKKETQPEKKPVRRRVRKVPDSQKELKQEKIQRKEVDFSKPKPEKHETSEHIKASGRHEKAKQNRTRTASIVILCFEVLVFCGVLYGLIHFSLKLKNGDFLADGKTTEAADSGSNDNGSNSSGSVNVDNDKFTLTCTKVSLTTDAEGNPAALIYFTFTNKTNTPLSLGEVFPPKVMQDGMDLETFAALENPPDELYNKDIQIQDGAAIEACYSVKLNNTTSELTLTIHDNYETFTDIGSTVIPLS